MTEMQSGALEPKELPTVVDEITEEENRLATKFRACCNSLGIEIQIHLQESADILLKMGKVYIEKAIIKEGMSQKLDFVKAAALIAGAGSRYALHLRDDVGLSETRRQYARLFKCVLTACERQNSDFDILAVCDRWKPLLRNIRDEERIFLTNKLPPLDPNSSEEKLASKRKQRVVLVKQLLWKSCQNYLAMMNSISQQCISILGDAPCQFAVVGLGSLAREEVTLYSDFEHMILLEDEADDSMDGTIREYFRWYSVLFQIIIIGLGETYIPTVGVKSINDLYSEDKSKNWFFDLYTPGGISFDGRFPHSCKIPIGKQEASKNRKHVVELIQPVRKMLRYLTDQENESNGYHLRDILLRTVLVDGNYEIYKLFNSQIGSIVGIGSRKDEITQQAAFVVENVNPFLRSAGIDFNEMDFAKVKDFFYRPVTILASCLARCCLQSSRSSFLFVSWFRDVITEHHKPSAEAVEPYLQDLEYAIAVACEIRAKLYASSGQQRQKALPKQVSGFVSENCIARCFHTIKITVQFFHSVAKIKPDSAQFFSLFAGLRNQTASDSSTQLDLDMREAFGFAKPSYRPGFKLGSDEENQMLLDTARSLAQHLDNYPQHFGDLDAIFKNVEEEVGISLPTALVKKNILLHQGRFDSAFETVERGWEQSVKDGFLTDPILLEIGLQTWKAGDCLRHMDLLTAQEYLKNEVSSCSDTLSKSVYRNYLSVAQLRSSKPVDALETLRESFQALARDAKYHNPGVVSVLLRDIFLIQHVQNWESDKYLTTSLLDSLSDGDPYKYFGKENTTKMQSIGDFLLPRSRYSDRRKETFSALDISDSLRMVEVYSTRDRKNISKFASALSILLYKSGIERIDEIEHYFRIAPDAVLQQPVMFHLLQISIDGFCKIMKNLSFWKLGRNLAMIFDIFSHHFESAFFVSSVREIVNAVVIKKLDLLKILEDLVQRYKFDGIEVMTILHNFAIERLQAFDLQLGAKFLWKIIFSKSAKREVKENCYRLLPQIIEIAPFVSITKYLKNQREDFVEKISRHSPEEFRSAVQEFTEYRFRTSCSSLWKIITSRKVSKGLLQRSLYLLNLAILFHLDSQGFRMTIRNMIAMNSATKGYAPDHVTMGDLHFGLSMASEWPSTRSRQAVENALYNFRLLTDV